MNSFTVIFLLQKRLIKILKNWFLHVFKPKHGEILLNFVDYHLYLLMAHMCAHTHTVVLEKVAESVTVHQEITPGSVTETRGKQKVEEGVLSAPRAIAHLLVKLRWKDVGTHRSEGQQQSFHNSAILENIMKVPFMDHEGNWLPVCPQCTICWLQY